MAEPVQELIKATSEAAPVTWSTVAFTLVGVLGAWLTFRGKQADHGDGLNRRLFKRIEKLEIREEEAKAKLDVAKRALDDLQDLLRERDEEIRELKEEVNAALHLCGRPPRYDPDGNVFPNPPLDRH